ncbi:MAG: 3'(2'),5'-bisphosphate nucleotidase CysQ [Desulfohalobiaceae bacterium]|nr:3'(2'),5'-bisphosphate nucleotidase CysQ [Desulfohalobiaceae bacterium]
MDQQHQLLAVQAALRAGSEIMAVYSGTDFALEYKADASPLTEADQRAHAAILKHLEQTGLPVLSEEGREIPYAERHHWDWLWIVDPLDGTKEFIKHNGEFTVNIALVHRQRPCFGVIYAPDLKRLYYGGPEVLSRSRRIGWEEPLASLRELTERSEPLPCPQQREAYVTMASRSHLTPEVQAFAEEKKKEHSRVDFISAGSSLKICRVAEGAADIYPRLGPTMEWDTAAGQAIAEGAGRRLTAWDSGLPLNYNREDLRNPWFVVA